MVVAGKITCFAWIFPAFCDYAMYSMKLYCFTNKTASFYALGGPLQFAFHLLIRISILFSSLFAFLDSIDLIDTNSHTWTIVYYPDYIPFCNDVV